MNKTISVEDYISNNLYEYENLFNFIFYSHIPFLYDNLILSSIGARICYSSQHILKILMEDKRIININDRIDFLKRLFKANHFSVFAHTPVFTETLITDPKSISLPYKAFKYFKKIEDKYFNNSYKLYICANMRHIAEFYFYKNIGYKEFFKFIEENMSGKLYLKLIIYYYKNELKYTVNYDIDNNKDSVLNLLTKIVEMNGINDVIVSFYIDYRPFDWYSFIFSDISRILTHQLVRHTWQNYCQISYRYVSVENCEIVIPESIKNNETFKNKFINQYNECKKLYKYFIENNIKKEDARYIIPAGVKTRIMTSAPKFVFDDFINKRLIPKAQWEIRNMSFIMKEIINN